MKKILLLSDIHIPSRSSNFPLKEILSKINIDEIDYIFALGDYSSNLGLDPLYSLHKEVYAVAGNSDDFLIKNRLPIKINITIEDVNIGLIHGWGAHFELRKKIYKEFENRDLICYGHTHSAYFEKENGIYFFNPGTLCGNKKSFGLISINNKKIEAKHYYI